ncbi:hypothetical protein GCM10023088_16430 [Actinomadura verrucosospora]
MREMKLVSAPSPPRPTVTLTDSSRQYEGTLIRHMHMPSVTTPGITRYGHVAARCPAVSDSAVVVL